MLVTTEVDYAIKCVLYLCMDQFGYISVADLAEKLSIPKQYLAKILQKLVKSGIVASHQGKQGGFRLGKNAEEIRMWDIFESLDAQPVVFKCTKAESSCSDRVFCAIHPLWMELADYIADRLKNTRVYDLGKKQFDNIHNFLLTNPNSSSIGKKRRASLAISRKKQLAEKR